MSKCYVTGETFVTSKEAIAFMRSQSRRGMKMLQEESHRYESHQVREQEEMITSIEYAIRCIEACPLIPNELYYKDIDHEIYRNR